jgi:uncharacterized protein YfbU (UPF0304 family)
VLYIATFIKSTTGEKTMGQLTITLPDELESNVREHVMNEGYGGVSDFVRDAVRDKLNGQSYWQRFTAAIALENNKLLKLAANERWNSEELLVGLQEGYTSEYQNAEHIVRANGLDKEETQFVFDVLHMFDRLQLAAKEAKDEELAKEVLFEGFDGNGDIKKVLFVEFLVNSGRFTFVKPLDQQASLNSHMPMNAIYRRMLDVFKDIEQSKGPGHILSVANVKAVLAAQIHPENR